MALERLLLRFGADEQQVLERRAEIQHELARVQDLDGAMAEDERELAAAEAEYAWAARRLGEERALAATKLAPAVEAQLSALALGKARFDVRLEVATGETVRVDGHDRRAVDRPWRREGGIPAGRESWRAARGR